MPSRTALIALATLVIVGVLPGGTPAQAQSVAFDLRPQVRATGDIAPDIRIEGRGWGHGVGMSQIGAQALALEGGSVEDILTTYYPGTAVTTDARASEQRIRAGIATGLETSRIRALDGTVTWQICSPDQPGAANGRVPAARCADWFTQPADEQLRVTPLPLDGITTPNGVQTHLGGDVTVLDDAAVETEEDAGTPDDGTTDTTDTTDTAATEDVDDTLTLSGVTAAPNSGILVERRTGNGSWEPHRAYLTPDDGRAAAQLPVTRVVHGSDRIAAQTYSTDTGAQRDADGVRERVYAHGWRDVHLTVSSASDGGVSYALAAVQDVDTIEEYLQGLDEVPSGWPAAALEAQVVTGRTYALRGSIGGACRCDLLSSPRSQVFRGVTKVEGFAGDRWQAAIDATRDQVLTYEGALAQTFYSSSHGGRSENVEDSWAYYLGWQGIDAPGATQPPPYLRSIDDPWSVSEAVPNSRRDWTATATNAQLLRLVNRERDELGEPRLERIERVRIGSRTEGGTPSTLLLTATTVDGERVEVTYRGLLPETRSQPIPRPVAGALLRRELALSSGGESNGRLSSSQITEMGFDPFTDDDGSTHEYAITWAAQAGIVQGVSETSFRPSRDVTRAQMATFLDNTFALPAAPGTADTFPDVTPGSTHHAAIEAIALAEITLGYDDGTYRPEAPVRRQEMATFLARAMALQGGDDIVFSDVQEGSTHDANIRALAASGITTGCAPERFCPAEPVSRGQLASFTYRSARR